MFKVAERSVEFDPERLLDAISVVESNRGRNNHPRFEVSYAPEGATFTVQGRILKGTGRNFNKVVAARWDRWGMRSACSYGPHQLLYHTAADLGYRGTPEALTDEAVSRAWAYTLLRRIVERGATTVEQVADAWNSGTHRDSIVPTEYIKLVAESYEKLGGSDAVQA